MALFTTPFFQKSKFYFFFIKIKKQFIHSPYDKTNEHSTNKYENGFLGFYQ